MRSLFEHTKLSFLQIIFYFIYLYGWIRFFFFFHSRRMNCVHAAHNGVVGSNTLKLDAYFMLNTAHAALILFINAFVFLCNCCKRERQRRYKEQFWFYLLPKTTHQQSCIKLKKRYIHVFWPYDLPNKLSTFLYKSGHVFLCAFSLAYKRKVFDQRHIYWSQCTIIWLGVSLCDTELVSCSNHTVSGEVKFHTFIFHIIHFFQYGSHIHRPTSVSALFDSMEKRI